MAARFRSIVMMPDDYGSPEAWYSRWSHVRGHYDFITGERLNDESPRQVALRCVTEQLPLRASDLLVANMAQVNYEFFDRQCGCDEPQHVCVAFYIVHLYRAAARAAIEKDPDGSWLSSAELLSGTSTDGKPVNPLLTWLLKRLDLVRI